MFERLSGVAEPRFLIDPIDLPFCFLLVLDATAPQLSAVRGGEDVTVTARISGPLQSLIDLLEGRADGDALFFSRTLAVEGDTEAVVALRNALDGGEINLVSDLLRELGPFAVPAQKTINIMGRLYAAACRDMDSVRRSVGASNERHIEILSAQVNRLGDTVDSLKQARRREKVK